MLKFQCGIMYPSVSTVKEIYDLVFQKYDKLGELFETNAAVIIMPQANSDSSSLDESPWIQIS